MFRPFTPSLALTSLLVSLTATAQAVPVGRSVVLTGKVGESPLIYLAPGAVTMIRLDARIIPESVQVEGRARFAVVEVGEQSVTLSPAVALVDIGLPGMDGYELARALRGRYGTSVRLVALTGYGQPSDIDRTRQAGFDAHLVKPVSLEAIQAALHA